MHAIAPIDASSAQAAGLLLASREQEELNYRSFDLGVDVTDNLGREMHIRFGYQELAYSRTYTRTGAIIGMNQGGATPGDRARAFTTDNASQQMAAFAERGSESLNASAYALSIEGDPGLIRDYFSTENTAQRIFDFVAGLGRGIPFGGNDFAGFLDQITAGIKDGFEQAKALFGDLPQVSQDTQSLLDLMLAQFAKDGQAVRASDLIDQLKADDHAD